MTIAPGEWESEFNCPNDEYIIGMEQRSEAVQGSGDDTATNKVRVRCSGGSTVESAHGTPWGDWVGMSECPSGQVVCGIRTQVETFYGVNVDDTGLNVFDICCCPTSHLMKYFIEEFETTTEPDPTTELVDIVVETTEIFQYPALDFMGEEEENTEDVLDTTITSTITKTTTTTTTTTSIPGNIALMVKRLVQCNVL